MVKFYIDSNVLISVLRSEIGKGYRPLSVEAEAFFNHARDNNETMVLSDLFVKEVKKKTGITKENIFDYFNSLSTKTEFSIMLDSDIIRAEQIALLGIHRTDAQHVAIAVRNQCKYIVTFNIRDFEKAKNLIEIIEPKEFI